MGRRRGRSAAALSLALALGACGSSAAVSTAPTVAPRSVAPTIAGPTPAASLEGRTPPPGVAFVHDGQLEPGTYWSNGFQPWLEIEIPGPGWEVGHFHEELFDLFFEGDFPAIAFARLPTVATPATSTDPAGGEIAATSIDVILDALRSNPDIVIEDLGPAEIAGLVGTTVDISVTRPQTALFGAGMEGFHFDPGFVGRFHLLAVEGGVVEIFVSGREGELDAAIRATQPILDSVRVVP